MFVHFCPYILHNKKMPEKIISFLSKYSKALLIVSNLIFENLQPVTSTLVHYTYCLCSFSHVSESVSLTIISFHGVARLWPSRKIMSFPHQTTTPVVHMKHAINLLSKKEFWQKPQNGHCCRAQPAPSSSQAKAAGRTALAALPTPTALH